ncbi:MAG: SAM-dependent chlorinase/fluorinase [Gammaproteobacteria bacterium]|jgi:S-adenosyl-L-methionine hydrolase (adenosine-forming)
MRLPLFTFTDFGLAGPYLGQVEERVYRIDPALRVMHLVADAPGYSPVEAGHLLAALASHTGEGVFLAVVDPGVGGHRKALAVDCGSQWFVGPDNGLFAALLAHREDARCFRIMHEPEVLSETFHGRDLFAPVAARLAAGHFVALEPVAAPDYAADILLAHCVVYRDHYGNLMTSIRGGELDEGRALLLGDESISHAPRFEAVGHGEAFWYVNSIGLVEIAVNQGTAAERFQADVGSSIRIAGQC